MEERRLTEDAKSWVFTQFASGIFPRSPLGSSCNAPNAFPNMFAPGRLQSISASVSASTSHFYDVLSILRFTKLRSIYAFSGWQANKKEIEEPRQHLATHMHDDISNARRCLIHAGAVFGSLRSGTQYGYCDPFCLLIATLYILAYVEFIIHKQEQNLNHISSGQQSIYTLCIDKHAAGLFALFTRRIFHRRKPIIVSSSSSDDGLIGLNLSIITSSSSSVGARVTGC